MKPVEVSAKLEVKIGDQAVTKSDAQTLKDVRPFSCNLYVPAFGMTQNRICTYPKNAQTEFKTAFVLIQSDTYDTRIHYAVAKYQPNAQYGGEWFSLEYPHLFMGEGQVNVLIQSADDDSAELKEPARPTEPNEMKIYVKNSTDKDVLVTIHWGLVERPKQPPENPVQQQLKKTTT